MTTKRRAKAPLTSDVPGEAQAEPVVVKDDPGDPAGELWLQQQVKKKMEEGTTALTAKVAELEAALATILPKVQEPKALFDMSKNSMDRVDEWVNEFTTEEVLKYIESAAHEENEINSTTLYAYRQRQAFEHKKAINDPTNCPGWFITLSGNIRRDY